MERGAVTAPRPLSEVDRARRRRRRFAVALAVIAVFAPLLARQARGPAPAAASDGRVRPARVIADSVRIKVEVINATSTRGLGRLATAWLRDKGFDVVAVGTAPESERRDSTLVLVRSGHADWGALAAAAMGGAAVAARPDSVRYLDLTILVGRDWRAPPQTLYP